MGRLGELDLRRNRLGPGLPDAVLGRLTGLTRLRLGDNRLERLPKATGKLEARCTTLLLYCITLYNV